jgi:predicted ATPase
MAYPNARIYLFREKALEVVDYESTEHFQVTRSFLNRHESTLKELFDGATPQTTMEYD